MIAGPLTDLLERNQTLVLDGAMGTELQRRGVDTGLPLWSARALLTAPETVLRIHREYAEAGADILTANTFRTTPRTLMKEGFESLRAGSPRATSPSDRAEDLTALAVALARKAAEEVAGRTVLVAGSLAPLEDCYRPDLVPSDRELEEEHRAQAVRLARAGVDFILLETMGTIREAVAAAVAARETGNEVAVSFICGKNGKLLGGEALNDAVRVLARLKPAVLSLNCVPLDWVEPALEALASAWPGPRAVYANAGRPEDLDSGEITTAVTPAEYAVHAKDWLETGVRIVGGCCGTAPDHVRALRPLADARNAPGGGADRIR
jgi:S-methylmethionine-dependent homocysteine/selenocysteine methylase